MALRRFQITVRDREGGKKKKFYKLTVNDRVFDDIPTQDALEKELSRQGLLSKQVRHISKRVLQQGELRFEA